MVCKLASICANTNQVLDTAVKLDTRLDVRYYILLSIILTTTMHILSTYMLLQNTFIIKDDKYFQTKQMEPDLFSKHNKTTHI